MLQNQFNPSGKKYSSTDPLLPLSPIQPVIKPIYLGQTYEEMIGANKAEENKTLTGSVGKNAQNLPQDVRLVQSKLMQLGLLSYSDYLMEQPSLYEEQDKSLSIPKTIEAIHVLQKYLFQGESFGIIKPGLRTINVLNSLDRSGLKQLKEKYQKQQEAKSKKLIPRENVVAKNKEENKDKKEIENHQDSSSLGKHLARHATREGTYIISILEKKWFWETDDIALAMLQNMNDEALGKCSRSLLEYLSACLKNGWTTEEEQVQINRIELFLNQKRETKKTNNLVLSVEVLREIFPKAKESHLKNIVEEITNHGTEYGINSYDKLAHYLAQAGHETGGFTKEVTVESGSYPTVERVLVVFGKKSPAYKKTLENPDYYLNNSQRFLNMAYANNNGNGNESSGEGYKYRGRGYFQLTGKWNYASFNNFSKSDLNGNEDFVDHPELIGSNNKYAIASSLWYFKTRTIQAINDKLDFDKITETINAAGVDTQNRKAIYEKAKQVFNKYYK